MSNINEYYNEIRMDIAKDFGIASVYAPMPKQAMTIRQYQILNNKYPSTWVEGQYRPTPNPKAILIAKRYNKIFGGK